MVWLPLCSSHTAFHSRLRLTLANTKDRDLNKTTYPARLHAIFAKDKPYGIVFRRGPSKQVCTFLWDRRKDAFEIGQWLKGRIYEKRADLSPDGKFLIYFAMNAKWNSATAGSWTAISKAPWLMTIVLQ